MAPPLSGGVPSGSEPMQRRRNAGCSFSICDRRLGRGIMPGPFPRGGGSECGSGVFGRDTDGKVARREEPMDRLGRLTPPQAWDFLQQNPGATLLDVRTALEYFYVGHPVGRLRGRPGHPPPPQHDQRLALPQSSLGAGVALGPPWIVWRLRKHVPPAPEARP